MKNKRVVINNGDGTVGILIPVNQAMTLKEIIKKDVPSDKKHRIVDISQIPPDRLFRNAWTDNNATDTVDIDMPRAKEIAHVIRRRGRDKQMSPLDIKSTIPSEMAQAEADREIVRISNAKLQIDIDKASNPEKLKSLIKEIL